MLQKINNLLQKISVLPIKTSDELESYRLKYLSKKGIISDLFDDFRNVPGSEKKEVGQKLNKLKQEALEKYNLVKSNLLNTEDISPEVDLSRPSFPYSTGSRHPISIVRNQIIDIFTRIGFTAVSYTHLR